MAGSDELSISAFARRVGLTPSALRFYDDCALLRPHRVDPASGYRFYVPDQERRALLLARLRRAAVPLPEARVVLDGTEDAARRVLEAHLTRTDAEADATRAAVGEILRTLAPSPDPAARVDGPEFAGAVRQVAPAALADDAAAGGGPGEVLRGVLVEIADGEVRVVATDRYRLSVRVLRPSEIHGMPSRITVPAAALRALVPWAFRAGTLTLEAPGDGTGLRLRDGADERRVAAVGGAFPDYAAVLDGLGAPRTRVVTDRAALVAVVRERADAAHVHLGGPPDELRVRTRSHPDAVVPAIRTGVPADIAFDPGVLAAALASGVGPDILLELTAATEPAVVRSADQGTFTTLAMPVRG